MMGVAFHQPRDDSIYNSVLSSLSRDLFSHSSFFINHVSRGKYREQTKVTCNTSLDYNSAQ